MRMVRIVDLVEGQAWTDPVQWRLNPPDGVAMHWSRIADLPVAAAVSLLAPVLGAHRAMQLAAFVVPPMLGGLFVPLFFWASYPLTERREFMAPFTMAGALVMPLVQFAPGRIDHHGLQLVLATVASGFLFRCLRSRSSTAASALGVVVAASLAVGLEMLPFVAAAACILAVSWILDRDMAASLCAFASATAAGLLVSYPLTVPPAEWTAPVCDRMALPHLVAALIGAVAAAPVWLVRHWPPMVRMPVRIAVAVGTGIVYAAILWLAFPQCAAGPYAELHPEIRYWFDLVSEARSLTRYFGDHPGTAAGQAALPLAALSYAAIRLVGRRSAGIQSAALFLLALTGAALLAWQIRNTSYAALAAAFALVPLAATINDRIDGVPGLLVRVALRSCIPLACAGAVLFPALVQAYLSGRNAGGGDADCDLTAVLPALTDRGGLGNAPRTIAAPIDLGPDILLRTRHRVLAAAYHRNVSGLVDNRLVFAGTESAALDAIRRRGVDAVLFCRRYASRIAFPGETGFLGERLGANDPPPWLVPLAVETGIGLYRVDLAATPSAASVRRTGCTVPARGPSPA